MTRKPNLTSSQKSAIRALLERARTRAVIVNIDRTQVGQSMISEIESGLQAMGVGSFEFGGEIVLRTNDIQAIREEISEDEE